MNSFFGDSAGTNNLTGGGNSFFGKSSGFNNANGSSNAFFGTETGYRNIDGILNTFVGAHADFDGLNSTGNNNTLLGALDLVSPGVSNSSAIGFRARVTQSNSVVLGAINGVNGATADTSVGIGTTTPGALLDVQRDGGVIPETARFTTYGSDNEVLGRSSGGTRTSPTATPASRSLLVLGGTGHDGTDFASSLGASVNIVANEAWTSAAHGSRISFRTTANGSISLFTRMTVTDEGDVGIGTIAPARRLHILGPSDQEIGIESSDANGRQWTLQSSSGASNGRFEIIDRTANASRMAVISTGNVGIGITAPSDKLHVNGIIRVATLGAADTTTALCRNSSNQIATCNSSSLRYKSEVRPFASGLEVIRRLRPISFTWKQSGKRDVGFGAEEVAEVEPLFTFTNDKGEIEGVKYDRISVLLVNAIKQQQHQIEANERQAAILQQQIKQQQRVIETLSKSQQEYDALISLVCADHPTATVCSRK